MKILIFGKTGQVGKELIREVERHNFSYLALGREDVNLSDDSHIKSVINDYSPDDIINAAAYTHTSVGISDSIAAISSPVIEVHISNIHAREEFRSKSLISKNVKGIICGFGLKSYDLAIDSIIYK